MQKYRVYTDGKTHAECIVEDCEAKVCSFKDPNHPARRGAQGAFCVKHHNQLVDLKVRRLLVVAFGAQEVLSRHLPSGAPLGKCTGQLTATQSLGLPVQSVGCRETSSSTHVQAFGAIESLVQARGCLSAGLWQWA